MATDKRARKKLARDEAAAARNAALQRRRLIRIAVALALTAGVVGFALLSGGDGTGNDKADDPVVSDESAAFYESIGCEPAEQGDEPEQFDSEPPELTAGTDYSAVVRTNCGDIEMDLLEQEAPATVASFVYLAEEGFFDGLIWHRVERNAVLQTGDPNGLNGQEPDGPGYTVPDEFPDAASAYIYGTVGAANAGPGTTGSQWFIVVHDPDKSCQRNGELLKGNIEDTPEEERFHCPAGYQPLYNVFAQVDPGSYETLEKIGSAETRGGNDPVEAVRPLFDIVITSVDIVRN